ncbi:MAG: hypothetical protein WA655_00240 [Candidatus Korobacteraceae bacterium]
MYFLLCALILTCYSPRLVAQTEASPAKAAAKTALHDGQHDFDPLLGSWKFHLKRRLNPLTGSNKWVDFEGTGTCRKVWDGAELEQVVFEAPDNRIEGLTLRLYNPQSHQWSLSWSNRKTGTLDPPQIGEFKDGVGEFFAQDRINGKVILIRFRWTNLTTNSPHFEQSFSDDGGKTWEVNWITDQTRIEDESDKAH